MTTSPNDRPDPRADLLRRIQETRAIDTKKALEGIHARPIAPRARKHSVFHRAFR